MSRPVTRSGTRSGPARRTLPIGSRIDAAVLEQRERHPSRPRWCRTRSTARSTELPSTLSIAEAVGPVVQKAIDAGIPTVAFNRGIDAVPAGRREDVLRFGRDGWPARRRGRRSRRTAAARRCASSRSRARSRWRRGAPASSRASPTPRTSTSTARTCRRCRQTIGASSSRTRRSPTSWHSVRRSRSPRCRPRRMPATPGQDPHVRPQTGGRAGHQGRQDPPGDRPAALRAGLHVGGRRCG